MFTRRGGFPLLWERVSTDEQVDSKMDPQPCGVGAVARHVPPRARSRCWQDGLPPRGPAGTCDLFIHVRAELCSLGLWD